MSPQDILRNDPGLRVAAAHGDGDAIALLTLIALDDGNLASARIRLERLQSLGHPTALHGLAALAEADGDDAAGWRLMQEALANGCAPALTRLARIAALRGADDYCERLLLRAANLGDPDAMYDVAHRATARGDDATAQRWYSEAVEREGGGGWSVARGVRYFLLALMGGLAPTR